MKHQTALIFILLFLSRHILQAQDSNLHFFMHREVITVGSVESGYSSSVLFRGKFTALKGRETLIRYNGFESLGGIKGTYRSGSKKFKPLPEQNIHHTDETYSPLSGNLSKYILDWPSKGDSVLDINYTYRIQCSELMTLSTLAINDLIKTDTFDYEIRVPKGILLYFHIPPGISSVTADSTETSAGIIYHFRSCPGAPIRLNRNLQPYEYCSFPARFIQLILVPEAYKVKAWAWLNDWYLNLLKNNPALSEQSRKTLDKVTQHKQHPDSIARLLFDFVKTRIRYADEEKGLGAFRPNDVNKTLQSKNGDCKDMANLLCEAMKQYHIPAWLALSSTLSYECELSFPSLSSADHMICIIRISNKTYYLDATDPGCVFGYPSLHIQGQKIFILNSEGGEPGRVPLVDASQNNCSTKLLLHVEGDALEGNFSASCQGLSRHDLIQTRLSYAPSDFSGITLKEEQDLAKQLFFSDWTTSNSDSTDSFRALVRTEHKLITQDGKQGIMPDFLPFPHKYPQLPQPDTRIILYEAPDNTYDCEINFGHPVHLLTDNKVTFNEEGFIFTFSTEQPDEKTIHIHYHYRYNGVSIPVKNSSIYFSLNRLIEKTLHAVIFFE